MAINLTKANSNTLTIKNTYRRALSLKFHVLNFKPNKGNLAFKSTQLKSVRAIKNLGSRTKVLRAGVA